MDLRAGMKVSIALFITDHGWYTFEAVTMIIKHHAYGDNSVTVLTPEGTERCLSWVNVNQGSLLPHTGRTGWVWGMFAIVQGTGKDARRHLLEWMQQEHTFIEEGLNTSPR